MSPIRKRYVLRRLSLAVVSVAVLLFALVPAVNALCALAALDVARSGSVVLDGPGARGDVPAPDACCTAIYATVVEASDLFVPGLARAIQPVGGPPPAERTERVVGLPRERALIRAAMPPPEPVSRRVPRLLI